MEQKSTQVTLDDIRLADYSFENLPRLQELRASCFREKPAICIERARYITIYLKHHDDRSDIPEVRRAKAVRYFLENKTPVFFSRANLLAGNTTSKPLGAPLFPEFFALSIWPELTTISTRAKNPQILDQRDARELNFNIFPYWMERNVLERTRARFGKSTGLSLFEDLVFFIAAKAGCISHCVPTYRPMLEKGLVGLSEEARVREEEWCRRDTPESHHQAEFFRAVQIALQGIMIHADHLADRAEALATQEVDSQRKKELEEMALMCRWVPAQPARTFKEAVQAIWLCQIGIHAENINMAMSPGRLDQILYPYYKQDMEAGRLTVGEAMEILASLWCKIADNVTMVPEASEEMFGGAGTVPALTLGGVDENEEDAVNDLTYLMLRVTELLSIRDPNVNARYHYRKNSKEYLERVSEVILNTRAVPAVYNDVANIAALEGQGERPEHARDYGVVGCVELVSCGRDYPASSSIMLNLVAPLEMALFSGRRPITGSEQIGPVTPDPATMTSFADFKEAFYTQLDWLIENAIELNEQMGVIHQEMLPSPLLSAFFEGPMEKGRDLIHGGSIYNSSGATHIGFADVVDSLNGIEHAVFNEKKCTFAELIEAIRSGFSGRDHETLRVYLQNRCPKFGTEHPIALRNSRELVDHLFTVYQSHTNYRGGPYRPAFWTMTNHAGLGGITGALPSGRKPHSVLASGITPVSGAAPELTACLNAVSYLGGLQVPGGWAFNLKYSPEPDQEIMKKRFAQTMEAYFLSGGHQVQFNIMTYEMLLDAKAHPDEYPELMVRVSGYSAYYKDLNEMMQDELITRTQYDLDSGAAVPFPGNTAGRDA
ncbi:formate C-acetyltransferase/glycerol dehydratase family glycyl radical enzyme [Desulfolithobacter dissulfuricans]|uniref:Formate C-acetyltransferase/glycerol dehydratase family glycyl radical enzyme n=1 Tax=Desulfolithobacter dissulfuricans TaxID=2795293 RepID=A0A915XI66_9BACT|nr:pyruvate formate lyase family protein [Desulfolithobacter dissulfuricans]BCO08845.1 formate C-acetyltransferase/glycerol dehydratase family glycyl radical enzyme [Desulfolithobacter dissulfuricans]